MCRVRSVPVYVKLIVDGYRGAYQAYVDSEVNSAIKDVTAYTTPPVMGAGARAGSLSAPLPPAPSKSFHNAVSEACDYYKLQNHGHPVRCGWDSNRYRRSGVRSPACL